MEILWGTFEFVLAADLDEALALLRDDPPDAVLLELLADADGRSPTLDRLLRAAPFTPVIVLTEEESGVDAFLAVQRGAQDFLLQPELTAHSLTRTVHASIVRKAAERQIAESRLGIVWRLARAAEFRDSETGNHVVRVGYYSKIISETIGTDREFTETLFFAAPLHDIGKIGIPDAILRKPGKLTDEEWAVMRSHCQLGADILSDDLRAMALYREWCCVTTKHDFQLDDPIREFARQIALTHHEWWNGEGYPQGLSRDEIPLSGRIVAVCDVFDGLLSERPYKRALTEEESLRIMEELHGRQFDPAVYAAFVESLPALREVREMLADAPHSAAQWPFQPWGEQVPC